ncbi:hypothetical protein [Desulfomonile tiedjei]|uniref:Uncharacterized protein n=1 Tax=Desulfomonile tiedjei (strain ATCC 49306 / DSM 6799 / DCB-1) TaxID=706587 RepID=I4C0K0_DESTA|nr:hypothetical protein [Desulfomonile tiedjei]AFM23091.1 hypothetical protein Desti_0354 [Desulfomonile tiedjei DSM 6799]
MKKILLSVVAAAFLLTLPLGAFARDGSRDTLAQMWKERVAAQKTAAAKEKEVVAAVEKKQVDKAKAKKAKAKAKSEKKSQ